jgi:transcriptional regulator with XRE-family HTH domain
MDDIQQLLKQADDKRKALRMSRKEWLSMMGITESNYYRWLKGTTTPRYHTIRKLAAFI